jgi:tetratricopeptide (TPR) repeat protein
LPGFQLKKALLIVTLSALFSATTIAQAQTAASPPGTLDPVLQPAPKNDETLPQQTVSQDAEDKAATSSDGPLPSVELTDALLFKLLRAELAAQRGDWQLAYATMLVTAQQTRDPRLAHRAAEIALGAKQTNEALSAVRLWRELAPNSKTAQQFYLALVMVKGDLTEAQAIFTDLLKNAAPKTRGMLILQIQQLLTRVKDKNRAFEILDNITTPYQALHETHIALAQSAFAKGETAHARAEAQIALRLQPDLEIAALMIAQATPDHQQALQGLKDFLDANPKARNTRMAYAKFLVEQKKYPEARAQLDILLADKPDDLSILYAIGVLGAQTDDLATAEEYLKKYVQTLAAKPDSERDPSQALLILAQIATERKEFPTALQWLEQVPPGPNYFDAQIQSARIMAAHGDLDGARRLLASTAAEGQQQQIQLLVTDAILLRDAKRMPEALAVMDKGVKRFPTDTELLYDYAMMAEKADDMGLMETNLRKIIKLAPKNQHAYNALGYSLADRNLRLQEALKLISKALQLAPQDPFILDSMGWVQFRLGHLDQAEEYLRRAYQIRHDVEVGVHLGEVLWAKGEREEAKELWRTAQQKNPKNDLLQSTLARLKVQL